MKAVKVQTEAGELTFTYLDGPYEQVWCADWHFPEWAGYGVGAGFELDDYPISDGRLKVYIESSEESESPSAGQLEALRWLMRQAEVVHNAVVKAIFDYYPKLKAEYLSLIDNEDEANVAILVPEIATPEDVKGIVIPASIFIFPHFKDEQPYFAFGFECSWDVEHGFGVLMNGFHAVAFAPIGDLGVWTIEADGGSITHAGC